MAGTNVIIIGGGLGGLVLAQALRKQGVACGVYERDASAFARSQGWAITLQSQMVTELKNCLPDDMPELEIVGHLYEHGISCEGVVYDASSGSLKEIRRFGPDYGNAMIRANRQKLRNYLLNNVNVHWDKIFSRYEQDETGITAFFEDGSTVHGDILVGADGIRSRVRTQLLPNESSRPKSVPLGGILGETTATREQYQRWMKAGKSYYSAVASDRRMTVALRDVSQDRMTANYYWLFGWADPAAVADDYWTTTASKEDLHRYVQEHVDDLHPIFAEVMLATPVEGMLHPPLRLQDMVPPELPTGRVTLLGDACHPMLPFRGRGGNTAIMDALHLAEIIGVSAREDIQQALKIYENEMRPRATEAVLASRAAATSAHAA